MELAIGKSILNRIATGKLSFYYRTPTEPKKHSTLSRTREEDRFYLAQRQAVLELAGLYDRASRQVGAGTASIFAIHAMLLEDEDFVQAVLTVLHEKHTTAEYAVWVAGCSIAAAFAAMDSPYMQARAVDIRDITRRVVRQLTGQPQENPLQSGAVILVSDEFLPSEVMDMDQRLLLGLVSRQGSVDSHTAMLLQSYGIPALAQVDLDQAWDGHMALLDGFNHRLYLDPERELVEQLYRRYSQSELPCEYT